MDGSNTAISQSPNDAYVSNSFAILYYVSPFLCFFLLCIKIPVVEYRRWIFFSRLDESN